MRRLWAAWVALALSACHLIGGIEEASLQCPVDGLANGHETDIDCGGGCAKCEDFKACTDPEDCASNSCIYEDDGDPAGLCFPALCFDGRQNGTESDVDCGGFDGECRRCFGGELCFDDYDCASVFLAFGLEIPACVDGHCIPSCCFEDCRDCDEICVNQCCEQPDPGDACCNAGCFPGGPGSPCDPGAAGCVEPLRCREVLTDQYRCL